ncbi:MAG: OadG family protein [Bacteroidales bacterium]|nr:OadG family protein [Bacteroidales bacterium]
MKKALLIVCTLLICTVARSQSQSHMVINEYLVTNVSDFQDDFGQQNGWVELFNTSYGTVDIGGCFLFAWKKDGELVKYTIPKGDVLTKIKPRQHVLFWADNLPKHGTFHTNFVLSEIDSIAFVGSDGRTYIDKVAIKDCGEDVSYGRIADGGDEWGVMPNTSPSTNNSSLDAKSKSMIMKESDPIGWILSLTSITVVFLALIILYLIFRHIIGRLASRSTQAKSDKSVNAAEKVNIADHSSETFAAIALALHLYNEENETHDDESYVVTQTHTDRSYSPWSSHIYGLRETPTLKKNRK